MFDLERVFRRATELALVTGLLRQNEKRPSDGLQRNVRHVTALHRPILPYAHKR